MNIKNLDRASEINAQLPKLEKARKMLSEQETSIKVINGIREVELPPTIKYNLIGSINLEINKLKEEVKEL